MIATRFQFVIALKVDNGVNYMGRTGCGSTRRLDEAARFDTHRAADAARNELNDLWVRQAQIHRVEVKAVTTVTVTYNDEYSPD